MFGLGGGAMCGGSLMLGTFFSLYQPVTIERMLLNTPVVSTMKTWPNVNETKPNAKMKCTLRAACRPPNIAGSQWKAMSSCGDIAMPENKTRGVSKTKTLV